MKRSKLISFLAASCLVMIAFYANQPARGDLVGFWDFDGNVDDHSEFGNDGELFDAAYDDNVPDAIGSGQSLSFEDDFAHVFVEGDESIESEEFTLSMFVFDRGQVGAMERLTSREGDSFETAINVHGPFSGVGEYAYYASAGGGWQWGEEVPPLEEWQHVAYVADVDEEELRIYVDGDLVWTTLDPWFATPFGFMHIGNRWNDVEGFDGNIDDVGLWDEALDDEAIKTISQAGIRRFLGGGAAGDYNGDGAINELDINLQAVAMNEPNPDLAKFDEDNDGAVNYDDRVIWVHDHKSTWVGDANLDGEFNSSDLVAVFTGGKYETLEPATWGEGDWNGNLTFDSGDLVVAFSDGGYELGPRLAAAAVPEPSAGLLLLAGLLGLVWRRRQA